MSDGRSQSQSEGSWRARVTEALASISDAVYYLDAEDRFTWVNAAAERLLRRSDGDLLGRHVWSEYPDLVGSPLQATYRAARRTGQPQHVEFFYPPLDRWFEATAYPTADDLVVFFRDVNERRTLDEERAAESSLIRAVLNALPSRTAILDSDGTILTTNAAWEAGPTPVGHHFDTRAGVDYLEVLRSAAGAGNADARAILEGLEAVLRKQARSLGVARSHQRLSSWRGTGSFT